MTTLAGIPRLEESSSQVGAPLPPHSTDALGKPQTSEHLGASETGAVTSPAPVTTAAFPAAADGGRVAGPSSIIEIVKTMRARGTACLQLLALMRADWDAIPEEQRPCLSSKLDYATEDLRQFVTRLNALWLRKVETLRVHPIRPSEALLAEVCECGTAKPAGKALCHFCYVRLPKALQGGLGYRLGGGFAESYTKAVQWLRANPEPTPEEA